MKKTGSVVGRVESGSAIPIISDLDRGPCPGAIGLRQGTERCFPANLHSQAVDDGTRSGFVSASYMPLSVFPTPAAVAMGISDLTMGFVEKSSVPRLRRLFYSVDDGSRSGSHGHGDFRSSMLSSFWYQ